MKPIADIMGQLHDKMEGMSKIKKVDLMKGIFGTTGIAAASALADSSKHLHSFTDEVKRANDMNYAQKLSKKNMDNPVNQLKRLKASFDQLGMSVSSTVAGPLTGGITHLNDMLTKLNHSSPALKKVVAGLAIGIPVISGALAVVGSGIRNVRTIASVTSKFHGRLDRDTKDEISLLKLKNRQLEEQIGLVQDLTREYGSMNRTESEGGTGSFSNSNLSSNGLNKYEKSSNSLERDLKKTTKISKFDKFSSRFGGVSKTGTKIGKVGKTAMLAKDASKFSKIAKFGGSSIAGVDVLTSLMDLQGINSKNAGGKIGAASGSLIGTGAGAALGTAIMPGLGTAVGAGVGSMASEWLGEKGGKYLQKELPKEAHQYKKDFSWTPTDFETHVAGPKIDTRNPFVDSRFDSNKDNNEHVHISKSKTLQQKELNDNQFDAQMDDLDKSSSSYVKTIKKQVIDAIGSAGDKSNNLFKKLFETANSYADKQKEKQKKNYDYLVKNGLISTKDASSDLNNYSQKQQQTINSIKQKIQEVNTNEHLSAKQRAKAVAGLNADLISLTDKGSKQQSKIKSALNNETQKMSLENYLQIRNDSKKAYNSTKSSAEKTKKTQIDAAAKKYDQEVKTARNTKGLSKSQRKYVEDQAQKQYENATQAAQDQYDGVMDKARKQHRDVVAEANDQAGDMKDAFSGAFDGVTTDLNTITGYSNTISRIFNNPSTETWKQPKDFNTYLSNRLKNPLSNGLNGKVPSPTNSPYSSKKVGSKKKTKPKKIKGIGGDTGYFNGFAKGTESITKDQLALLGENGTEAVYNPHTGKIRFVNNGPSLSNLKAGEHVLNAKDTQKLLHGGLGHNVTLQGYAKGTDNNSLNKKEYSIKLKNNKSLDKFKEHSKKIWKNINEDTKGEVSKMHKNTTKKTRDTKKDVLEHFSDIQKGAVKNSKNMTDSLNTIFGKVPKYARSSMSSSINALNQGFNGINSTLNQFGDSKNVLSPIHYASGSNGQVTREHMAIVNDAKSGPEQEAIVKQNGVFLPKNKNHLTKLSAGDSVLNGTQTRHYLDSIGLAHYAKGTGVSDDALKKLINSNIEKPKQSLNDNFKNKLSFDSKLSNNVNNATKKAISPDMEQWYQQIWKTLKDATGSSSEFLNYAKKNFTGDKYQLGSNGPDMYDCSSMVEAALNHFGIQLGRTTVAMQNSSQLTRLGKNIDKSRAGDLVLFGHGEGANGHVGIVDSPANGTMFNETPPRAGVTNISDVTSVPLDGYYRINGLHNESDNNNLSKLTKKQLGKKRLDWVAKHLGEKNSFNGPIPTGDHSDLLKQAGIPENEWSAFNYIISNESSWNPHAENSSGAYGLPQSLPARKMSSVAGDWRDNPVTQLKWMKKYVKSAYGGIFNAQKYWQNHHNYENGGLISHEQMAHVGEKNKPEMVLPLTNKSRTVQLAQQALKYVHAMNGNEKNPENDKISQLEKIVDKMSKENKQMVKILSVIADKVSQPTRAVVADKDLIDTYKKYTSKAQMSAAIRRGENILG